MRDMTDAQAKRRCGTCKWFQLKGQRVSGFEANEGLCLWPHENLPWVLHDYEMLHKHTHKTEGDTCPVWCKRGSP